MKTFLSNKAVGYYFALIACVIGVVSCIRFQLWGASAETADTATITLLVLGVVLGIVLLVRDNSLVMIASAVCYTAAGVKIITDNVGSFVDYVQKINMFGDASQVGNILSMSGVIGISVLLSLIASFLKRVKV